MNTHKIRRSLLHTSYHMFSEEFRREEKRWLDLAHVLWKLQEHNIRYCALDFSHLSKHRDMNVLKALEEVAAWTVGQVGFFCRQASGRKECTCRHV